MPEFIPGLDLARRFYWEAIRPALDAHFPGLPHAAALVGPGSDVLGYDTEMSRDHEWGPRGYLFLRDEDAALAPQVHAALRQRLPRTFLSYPVSFQANEIEPHIRRMTATADGPVDHHVTIEPLSAWTRRHLGLDPTVPLDPADWLTLPSQKLLETTAGEVFYDSLGDLTALRERLAWYPHDVWLYLLAAGWQRIGQEEHLMPRAGHAGDELGSALIGWRLVRDVMSLAFLMGRRYAPYPKWFGAAFNRLPCAPDLAPALWQAQQAATWPDRQAALVRAYEYLAAWHNGLALTPPLPATASLFFGRPFRVIWGSAFANALRGQISDPDVRRIAERGLIGGIDQLSDNTDLRSDVRWRPALRQLYGP